MKKLYILLVVLLGTFYATAQKVAPGYIVLKEGGDTLRSEVKRAKFKDWREFEFIYPDGEKVSHSASSVRAMQFGDRSFVSFHRDSIPIAEPIENNGEVLLEVLETGAIDLYKIEFCFEQYDFQEQKYRVNKQECMEVYLLQKEGEPLFQAFRKTKNVGFKKKQVHSLARVAGYFRDYEKLAEKIQYEELPRDDMATIVAKYNEWASPQE